MQHGSPFSLSTRGIFPNQVQAISPMVCRWGLRTWPGCTACIGNDFGPKPPDTMVRERNLTYVRTWLWYKKLFRVIIDFLRTELGALMSHVQPIPAGTKI